MFKRFFPWRSALIRRIQPGQLQVASLWYGLALGLPLLVLSLAFWGLSGLVTRHIVTTSTQSVEPVQVVPDLDFQRRFNLLTIRANVDRQYGRTHVKVSTLDSPPQILEFEVPATKFDEIEGAIAHRLELPPHTIRGLVRYQILDGEH
jgi:hypothetical protein